MVNEVQGRPYATFTLLCESDIIYQIDELTSRRQELDQTVTEENRLKKQIAALEEELSMIRKQVLFI